MVTKFDKNLWSVNRFSSNEWHHFVLVLKGGSSYMQLDWINIFFYRISGVSNGRVQLVLIENDLISDFG